MIYNVRHVTIYQYDAPVMTARCTLRLIPRSDHGQMVLDSGLEISPPPVERLVRFDFFGNRTISLHIDGNGKSHSLLRVMTLARVQVQRDDPPSASHTLPWEEVRKEIDTISSLNTQSPAHGVHPSRLIQLHDPITEYARHSFPKGRAILEAAVDLMHRLKIDFVYQSGATAISTPLLEAFHHRAGVCQDFAHIMIAGLRGLGLSALYVSGYIRTIPPEGQKRLEGADASHAWVSVWCGSEIGWVDLDPTNDIYVKDDHILLARGRDYADVSPIDGVFVGSGGQKLSVSVDVAPHV